MSELKAADIAIGGGVETLMRSASANPDAKLPPERFGEGQLSGPHGPQFAGFGPMPEASLAERWGATVAIAAALFGGSLLLMLAAGTA